jgi:osmotically-inducible protein OsmY
MSKKINPVLAILLTVFLLIVSVTSCKQKTSDADIKTAVDNTIAANSTLSGTYSDVKDGVVTLTGEVKDDAAKTSAEAAAKGINGVKSVVNNLTVAPPPAPVEITPDDPLKAAVENAIKSYPGVKATIQNGVVTLSGEIKKADLQKMMMALNSLKPKSIDNTQLTIK